MALDFFQQGLGEYEPTSIDDEMFLTQVSLDLLEQNIQNQFADPEEYRKQDTVKSFLTKYKAHRRYLTEEEEYIDQDELDLLEERYDDFTQFMQQMIDRYLNVTIPNFEDLPRSSNSGAVDNQEDILHLTYRFFIKNIKKNFVNIILNYIDIYSDEIITKFSIKNDVTYNNFKDEINNEADLVILTNLSDIVDYVFNNIGDVDDFFKLCMNRDKPNIETLRVYNWFERFELTGNFVDDYIEMISSDFKYTIGSKVRNKILSKYPNRKSTAPNEPNTDKELGIVEIDD